MQWHAKAAAVLTPAVLPVAVCDSVLALLTSVHSSARAGHVPTLLRTCNELTCVPVHALLHAALLIGHFMCLDCANTHCVCAKFLQQPLLNNSCVETDAKHTHELLRQSLGG
jgi:hypothetical protein